MKTYFVETHAFVRDTSVERRQNVDEMGQKVEESGGLGDHLEERNCEPVSVTEWAEEADVYM